MIKILKCLLLTITVFTLTNCIQDDYSCDGEIVLANKISDITMQIGDKPYQRDLLERPVVFRHTENKTISIIALGENNIVANVNLKLNEDGRRSNLVIIPNTTGSTRVDLIATYCPDYEKVYSFNVFVTDSTSKN